MLGESDNNIAVISWEIIIIIQAFVNFTLLMGQCLSPAQIGLHYGGHRTRGCTGIGKQC